MVAATSPSVAAEATAISTWRFPTTRKAKRASVDRPGVAGHTTLELMREGAARRSAAATLHGGEHFVPVGANHIAVAVPVPLPR